MPDWLLNLVKEVGAGSAPFLALAWWLEYQGRVKKDAEVSALTREVVQLATDIKNGFDAFKSIVSPRG